MQGSIAGVVLAAGAGIRFGGSKLLAPLGGRALLVHVLDAARDAGLEPLVVVIGPDGDALEPLIDAADAHTAVNPRPEEGISSSLRIGIDAARAFGGDIAGAAILLGDQPAVSPAVIRALASAVEATPPGGPEPPPLVAPRYAGDTAPNPVIIRREAFDIVDAIDGDRGLGLVIAARPDLVTFVPVEGANPDVDTRADLAAAVEVAWAARVRANREQVDRVREVPDGPDFYGPVSGLFRADPDREGDLVRDALVELAREGETWLDVGAGAGRYALPLARVVGRVVAIDTSPAMLAALREDAASHGIANVEIVEGRWPPVPGDAVAAALGPLPCADVALIANVGYDIEAIGSFLDGLDAAARRLVVAVLMERAPASLVDPFWPAVHGEARVALPALPELVELLEARGLSPDVRRVERDGRRFGDREALLGFLRRQLWTAPGSAADRRLEAELDAHIDVAPDGSVGLADTRGAVGIITWVPRP